MSVQKSLVDNLRAIAQELNEINGKTEKVAAQGIMVAAMQLEAVMVPDEEDESEGSEDESEGSEDE